MQEINSLCSCPLWFLGVKGLALELEDSERHPCDVSVKCEGFGIQNLCILVVDPFTLRILSHPRDVRVLGTRYEYSSHLMSLRLSSKICGKKRVTNLETEVIGSTFIGTGFQRVSASFLQMLGCVALADGWPKQPLHPSSPSHTPHATNLRGSTFVGQRVPTILRSFWVAHPPFFGPEWVFRSRTSSWAMLDH